MKKIIPSLLAGLCLAPAAMAAEKPLATIPVKDRAGAETLTRDAAVPYTFAELGYSLGKFDQPDGDATTLMLGGSYLVLPSVFVVGAYTTGEIEASSGGGSLDVTSLQLGGGYRHALSATVDLTATLKAMQIEAEAGAGSSDETGFQLGIGARGELMDKVEGAAGVSYTDVFDKTSTTLTLAGLYNLSQFVPKLQAGLELSLGDDPLIPSDAMGYGVKVRYSF